jgi:hypothetical protein
VGIWLGACEISPSARHFHCITKAHFEYNPIRFIWLKTRDVCRELLDRSWGCGTVVVDTVDVVGVVVDILEEGRGVGERLGDDAREVGTKELAGLDGVVQ